MSILAKFVRGMQDEGFRAKVDDGLAMVWSNGSQYAVEAYGETKAEFLRVFIGLAPVCLPDPVAFLRLMNLVHSTMIPGRVCYREMDSAGCTALMFDISTECESPCGCEEAAVSFERLEFFIQTFLDEGRKVGMDVDTILGLNAGTSAAVN